MTIHGTKLPWERVEQDAREFADEILAKLPLTEHEVRIIGVYFGRGEGRAVLYTRDRDGDSRTFFISSGFGIQQFSGAGVTVATWLRLTVDAVGVVESFEVIT